MLHSKIKPLYIKPLTTKPYLLRFSFRNTIFLTLCSLIAFVPLISPTHAQAEDLVAPLPFVIVKANTINYVEKENGIRSAVIFGDPDKPGMYITRNIFPGEAAGLLRELQHTGRRAQSGRLLLAHAVRIR